MMTTHPTTSTRTPVYFLSIGGPNFIEDTSHPAYAALASVGQEITQKVKPKAVVVFSAHWAGGPDTVEINVAEHPDLIYDFYGFPKHYYEVEYPNRGSKEIAEKVIGKLEGVGLEAKKVDRGLDHGVWAGFLAAFDPKSNPLGVPIVQVSLFDSEDTERHYRLGQALEGLRDEGILIVGAGMSVHNLYDFMKTMRAGGTGGSMPYTHTFDKALKEATTAKPEQRQRKMRELMERKDAKQAHPSVEHLMPVYIAAGAAGEDTGERIWTMCESGLGWAQYRFGGVEA